MHSTRPPAAWLRWALYVGVFLAASAFRFIILDNGFPNDHFVYITGGWQMLMGEWPTRDWIDPGLPLMFLASWAAQALLGPTLFAEAVLTSCAFGLAAALTVAAVLESGGSTPVALLAALLELLILPRTYGYPKVLAYVFGFLCYFRYVARPGSGRLWMMAIAVAVGFLFRHDHGLYLGVGALACVLLAPEPGGPGMRVRRVVLLGAAVLALVLPYLIYVGTYAGIAAYFETGLEVSRREAARQWHVWPTIFGDAMPLLSALVYQFHLIPFFAIAVLIASWRDPHFRTRAAIVVPVALVALLVNVSFIRDPLISRVPDAIAPAVVLGAWLFDRAWRAGRWRALTIPASVLALGLFSASVLQAGDVAESLDRIGPLSRWTHVRELLGERSGQLHQRFFAQQLPSRAATSLVPFFTYLDRCTTLEHRLLVGGFMSEVPFFAQRRFAAGQEYFGGSFGSEAIDRRAIAHLPGQVVPFAIIPSDAAEDFDRWFPLVSGYVKAHYVPLTEVRVSEDDSIRILVDPRVPSSSRDAETGWPCFKNPAEATEAGFRGRLR